MARAAEAEGSEPDPRLRPGYELLLVLAAMALCAALQFADLDSKSLWVDEVASVRIAGTQDLGSFFDSYRRTERQPPIHHLLLF
ncbi:MAG: hypothetical protein ACRDI1_02105, partial [Actinomycetota bacterium]